MEIKKNPVIYLGKPSLERLHAFLSGYSICMMQLTENSKLEWYPGFDSFVQKKYGMNNTNSTTRIIDFMSSSEEAAFYTYFELLDEFIETQNK